MPFQGKAHPSGRPCSQRDIGRLRYLQWCWWSWRYIYYDDSLLEWVFFTKKVIKKMTNLWFSSVPSILPKLCQSYHTITARETFSHFINAYDGKHQLKPFLFTFFSEFSCVLSWVICYISKRKIPNERASYEWVVSPQSHYYADAIQKKPHHWLSFDHHQHFPWTKTFSTPMREAKYTEGGPNGLLECYQ